MSTEAIDSERDRRKARAAEEPYRLRSLSRLSNALNRCRGRILLLTLAATTAMMAYVLLRPNVYVAHTEILVDNSASLDAYLDEPSLGRRSDLPQSHLGSQIKLIGSALIVEKVVDQIHPTVDQGLPFSPRDIWRLLAESELAPEDDRKVLSRRLETFRSHLKIEADPSTSVITISYRSKDPEVAAEVANGLAKEFLEHRAQNQQRAIQQASQQAQRVVETTLASVRGTEAPQDDGVPSAPSTDSGASPIEQRYARLSEELTNATLELADTKARLAEADAARTRGAIPDSILETELSPQGAELLARDRGLRRQIRTLSNRKDNDDAALIRAEADLIVVQEALEEESARIQEKLRLQLHAAEARFKELQTQVGDVEAKLSNVGNGRFGPRALADNDARLQRVYEAMLERSNRISGLAEASSDKTRIIEPAVVPSSPSMTSGVLLIELTFMGTSGFGFLWAVLAELKRKGFNDAHEAETYLGRPVLGMLPNVHGVVPLAAKLRLSSREKHWALEGYAFIEGVRGIFNTILPPRGEGSSPSGRVVAITSCFPGEGKTILALSLARQSASGGAKVLLIEGDMRKVGLATKLSTVSPKYGLVDLLSAKVDRVDDVIVSETESGADLLLASGPSEDAFALSRSPSVKNLIGDLRTRYDLIIVDCPPVLGVSDTLALCDVTDEILFVIRWQETDRAAVRSAIRELAPRPIAGVVLTQVDLASQLKYATASKYRYQDEFISYAVPGGPRGP